MAHISACRLNTVPATDVSIESAIEGVQIELLPALQTVGWIPSHAPLTASRTRSNPGGGFYSAFAAAAASAHATQSRAALKTVPCQPNRPSPLWWFVVPLR
ncbi:MAG UNVERIFIED_CONTAM: hypothetical protein LVR18_47845 [Planctomycetaceae bacterium]